MSIIGIDPGATGALALLTSHGALLAVADMPVADKQVIAAVLADIVRDWQATHTITEAVVEKVHAMPRQGVASSFRFGDSFGVIRGVLGALAVPSRFVTPAAWKKQQGVTADKGTSLRLACELWPEAAGRFARKKDDGRAEAALIARCGLATQPREAAP